MDAAIKNLPGFSPTPKFQGSSGKDIGLKPGE
jgi:hypothetical protein